MVSVDCCFIIYYIILIYNNLIFNTEFNKIASKRDVHEKKLFRFIFIIDTIHDCMLKNSMV